MKVVFTLIALATYIFTRTNAEDSCGGYVEADSPATGYVTSPGFPGIYPVLTHCIWLLVASADNTRFRLTVHTLQTEQAENGTCSDFIEVRSGSSTAHQLFRGCSATKLELLSTSRWLWIRFYSDNSNVSKGFNATWQTIEGEGLLNEASPINACPNTKFRCSNYECVSWSWVCDSWRDCGCSVDCDEDTCTGLGYTYNTILSIGLVCGGLIFIIIVIVVVFWDRYIKRKNKRLEEERTQRAKDAIRLRHNANNVRFMTQYSHSSSCTNKPQLITQLSSSSSSNGHKPHHTTANGRSSVYLSPNNSPRAESPTIVVSEDRAETPGMVPVY